jgi:hypothetical protein
MPAVAERRRALTSTWYTQLIELTQEPALESSAGERALDALFMRLRRAWMSTAHQYADITLRSPAASEGKMLPSRTTIDYGYERSLERTPLEDRIPA